jgi:hypothetical protein
MSDDQASSIRLLVHDAAIDAASRAAPRLEMTIVFH